MADYPPGSKEGLAEAERLIAECKKEQENRLDLSALGLTELPESVRALRWLNRLEVDGNALTTLPSWIGELTSLELLHLHGNRLERLPPEIRHLQNLSDLALDNAVPEAADAVIGELRDLKYLSLRQMDLAHIPPWLRKLRVLRYLYLSHNDISVLPAWLSELPLTYLSLHGNDKLGLPPEIIAAAHDPKRILDYYFRIAGHDAAQPLNEFKLVLVGRGGVGKTTLVHRLVEDEYREFPETPGIRIAKWPVTIDGEEKRAHVWDFGGQEIMHGTHRFFMTERALYLVLLSRRENLEDRDAEYWLSLVRSFAGDVPVIVLLHKCDSGLIEVNRRLLREKYGESIAFLETDSSTGTGIRELRERICQLAGALPGLQTKWPRAWHQVKEELPEARKNWMTFEEFCAFCAARGVPERKDQEALAESLHDLGLMLAYRREEALRGFGVLNPQWVTNGIYAVLNAPALKEAGGRFTVDDLATILAEADYPRTLHPYLLALMRKFKLCHPLDDAGTRFLIPELLTKEEPAALDTEFPPAECLGFVYRYDTVLPEGLLSRFIVETYVHRAPRHAWRTGVVLEREGCRALIRGDVLGRRIAILVTGSTGGRRVLLGIVREHFERIHKTFEKLPVTELVPIPGAPGVEAEYSDLRAYEDDGHDEYNVVINRRVVKQSVQALLDGVDVPGRVRDDLPWRRNADGEPTVRVFVSYSHKDAVFLDNLRGHLTPYERSDDLEVWADPLLEPGQQWSDEIFTNLDRSEIMILLLSADSLRSKFCIEKELARAVELGIEIVPILIRACRFDKDLTLGPIQVIRPGGKPVRTARNDKAWVEVTHELDKVIKRVRARRR